MRLNEFIIQKDEYEKNFLSILKKECIPFLKFIGKTDFLCRGSIKISDLPGEKRFMHDKREPLSTPKTVHDELNKIFLKKFGWPVRNGIFCVFNNSMGITATYGATHYVFGVGDFNYCYSNIIKDLWTDIDKGDTIVEVDGKYLDFKLRAYRPGYGEYLKKIKPKDKEYLKKFVDKFYTDKNLSEKYRGEVSFNFPNGYYVVSINSVSKSFTKKIKK